MKTKIISLFYFLSGALFIILEDRGSFFSAIVIKALIIPVLMILFLANFRSGLNRSHRLILAGLFFSWAGDVILEFSHINGNLFIPGLVCFLLAHLMYFTVFYITPGESVILSRRIYFLIPVLLYGIVLICYLYDDLASMRIPVIIYSVVILAMLTGAIDRIKKVNSISFYLTLTGAVLFVISDSAIAVNKFSYPFEYSSIVIMSTYVIAQYLIVTGYINQFRDNFE
jgi:uncharacterized membrane protein YhhN